eukprot:TRINITY_DN5030_c0_g1_i1.p1 TRINITY_DN5030_c0_g1~~TRINITY_DN5030_c0_g1_i1.p1  ORF type:complete len:433 (+),score=94.21 TRINITY_DN5030_c0_g1_i1:137-1435(+)
MNNITKMMGPGDMSMGSNRMVPNGSNLANPANTSTKYRKGERVRITKGPHAGKYAFFVYGVEDDTGSGSFVLQVEGMGIAVVSSREFVPAGNNAPSQPSLSQNNPPMSTPMNYQNGPRSSNGHIPNMAPYSQPSQQMPYTQYGGQSMQSMQSMQFPQPTHDHLPQNQPSPYMMVQLAQMTPQQLQAIQQQIVSQIQQGHMSQSPQQMPQHVPHNLQTNPSHVQQPSPTISASFPQPTFNLSPNTNINRLPSSPPNLGSTVQQMPTPNLATMASAASSLMGLGPPPLSDHINYSSSVLGNMISPTSSDAVEPESKKRSPPSDDPSATLSPTDSLKRSKTIDDASKDALPLEVPAMIPLSGNESETILGLPELASGTPKESPPTFPDMTMGSEASSPSNVRDQSTMAGMVDLNQTESQQEEKTSTEAPGIPSNE